MSTNPDRSNPTGDPGSVGRPGPERVRGGGPEGGTLLVVLLLGTGLVVVVLKFLGVLG